MAFISSHVLRTDAGESRMKVAALVLWSFHTVTQETAGNPDLE